jgi:hypothetical protein
LVKREEVVGSDEASSLSSAEACSTAGSTTGATTGAFSEEAAFSALVARAFLGFSTTGVVSTTSTLTGEATEGAEAAAEAEDLSEDLEARTILLTNIHYIVADV